MHYSFSFDGTVKCNGVPELGAFASSAAHNYHTGADMGFDTEEFWLSLEAARKSYTFRYLLSDSVCLSYLFMVLSLYGLAGATVYAAGR
jgi:hypothetical protein